ncbi:MAG: isoprenylcysteine carboxylmethyltransferase family protein [Candidatus Helarchaeota archaeon]|nr:isoprenylcysteine carboxylmethyltransferase family protein [Candidatus Helarchaeota archaeon]
MITTMEIVIAVVLFASLFPGAAVKRYYRKKAEKLATGKSPLKNKTERILTMSLLIAFSTIFGFLAPFFLVFDVYHLLMDWSSLAFLITSSRLLITLQIIGICLYIIGYIIYLTGRLAIGERFSELWSPARISDGFAHTGIFSRWRHPLYSGSIIFSFGLVLMFQTWFGLLLYIYPLYVMIKTSLAEERWLIERFGDEYEQYMKRSWRFFPKLW